MEPAAADRRHDARQPSHQCTLSGDGGSPEAAIPRCTPQSDAANSLLHRRCRLDDDRRGSERGSPGSRISRRGQHADGDRMDRWHRRRLWLGPNAAGPFGRRCRLPAPGLHRCLAAHAMARQRELAPLVRLCRGRAGGGWVARPWVGDVDWWDGRNPCQCSAGRPCLS